MYNIILQKKALNFFKNLDKSVQGKIGKKIEQLKQNPKIGKALVGNLTGLWRLRIEKYRAIYQIKKEELIIFVLDIGHRKNVYY